MNAKREIELTSSFDLSLIQPTFIYHTARLTWESSAPTTKTLILSQKRIGTKAGINTFFQDSKHKEVLIGIATAKMRRIYLKYGLVGKKNGYSAVMTYFKSLESTIFLTVSSNYHDCF